MAERIDARSALIIVDVQNDFCPGGSLPVPEGDRVVPVINRVAPLFSLVAASQDWHPRGHVSFASSHPGRAPFEEIDLGGRKQMLWPDHCVPGTRGAELHPDLDIRPIHLIIRKGWHPGIDSYSVFFENDHRTPTGLEPCLKGLGVRRVYLAGLAQDICVYYSAQDALRLGFGVTLIEDAACALDEPPGTAARRMRELEEAGMRRARSADLAA
jgi:nicotinamidase/pyrazinamidase